MWAKKIDTNQQDIVDALLKIGCSVYDASRAGGGFPDLVVGYRQCTYLVEVKSGKRKLNPKQKEFHEDWRGNITVVRSPMEAIKVVKQI